MKASVIGLVGALALWAPRAWAEGPQPEVPGAGDAAGSGDAAGQGDAAGPSDGVVVVIPEVEPTHLQVLVEVGGGTLIAYDAADETGNAFGGLLGVRFDQWEVLFGGAVALPDSRLQGRFGALWAEGRYLPMGSSHLVTPYVALGAGMSLQDAFTGSDTGFIPARWSTGTNLLGMVAVGARFGEQRGLYLGLDARAWNLTQLGLSVVVGCAFL